MKIPSSIYAIYSPSQAPSSSDSAHFCECEQYVSIIFRKYNILQSINCGMLCIEKLWPVICDI